MDKIREISIVEEGNPKQIRMANLCITGSHSTNGVAALHTELLKSRLVPSFAKIFPKRFNNQTPGITLRRWLLHANPALAALITETIGDEWITNFAQLRKLEAWAEDKNFRTKFQETKLLAKRRLSECVEKKYGIKLNPEAFYNVQIKRMHEYKRQLLNIMQIIMLYNRIRKGNPDNYFPRISIFAGKSAPGYDMAKLIIKLINNVSGIINYTRQFYDCQCIFLINSVQTECIYIFLLITKSLWPKKLYQPQIYQNKYLQPGQKLPEQEI
jgi:starch phosphorylase